jgi:excisionase family DNA binding protein
MAEQQVLAWLTTLQAAARAQVSESTILREARALRLRSVRVGGRRNLRVRPEWVDSWLEGQSPEAAERTQLRVAGR